MSKSKLCDQIIIVQEKDPLLEKHHKRERSFIGIEAN